MITSTIDQNRKLAARRRRHALRCVVCGRVVRDRRVVVAGEGLFHSRCFQGAKPEPERSPAC